MSPSTLQREQALEQANCNRKTIAAIKQQIRDREVHPADLLLNPPEALHPYSVFEVMLLGRQRSYRRHPGRVIGNLAVRDQVNVLITVGEAPPRTLEWAARYAPRRHQKEIRPS